MDATNAKKRAVAEWKSYREDFLHAKTAYIAQYLDVTTKSGLQSIEDNIDMYKHNTNTFTSLFLFLGVLLGLGSGEFELQM